MIKSMVKSLSVGILIAFLGVVIPSLSLIFLFASPIVAVIAFYLLAPDLSREAWRAEEAGGVLVLMHGDDYRIRPLAAIYHPSTNMLVPMDKRLGFQFVPDPDSTVPIEGQKSKLAITYINHPFTIKPDHIILAYDLKRLGIRNLAQALEVDRNFDNLEALKEHRDNIARVYQVLLNTDDPDKVDESVWEVLGVQKPSTQEEYLTLRDGVANYLNDIDSAISYLEKQGAKRVFKIGARFYTIKDVLGFLGIRTRLSALRNLVESARLEERMKLRDRWGDMKLITLFIFGIIGIIVVIALLTGNGSHTVAHSIVNASTGIIQQTHTPTQTPTPTPPVPGGG